MKSTLKDGTSIVRCGTQTLCDQHEALNCTKGRGVKPVPGLTQSTVKWTKLAAKVELTRRAKAGDAIAVAYATVRKWPGFASTIQTMAAE